MLKSPLWFTRSMITSSIWITASGSRATSSSWAFTDMRLMSRPLTSCISKTTWCAPLHNHPLATLCDFEVLVRCPQRC
ncbi:MAG TPA: hypothetical protein VFP61_08525 [Acidimicrobiales bacterium]|nr:hypothetical protein [Acidimicrobiales bacterium]